MIRHTRLSDCVDDYALSHEISDETAAFYHGAIRHAQQWAEVPLTTATICDKVLNGLLVAMQAAGRSPAYTRSIRNAVLAIWRDAASSGRCSPPGKIRPVRQRSVVHTIWGPTEVGRILDVAQSLTGQFRTVAVDRATYWDTLIRAAWDSGLRRRDLQQWRSIDLSPDFIWLQHKTGKPVRVRLRAETLDRIARWGRQPGAVLWPIWGCGEVFGRAFRLLVRQAGIPMGPFKTIRKSAGTMAEAVQPGAGHLLLGNTRAVFERHYLDVSKVLPPRPPELDQSSLSPPC